MLPFLHDPLGVPRLLRLIRLTSHPRVVSDQHLRESGFGSDEIPGLVSLLEALGMIDARRQPTSVWTEFRHSSTPRRVLARAMRPAYAAFFATLRRPDRHDDVALELVVRDRTDLDHTQVRLVVATFRALCRSAGLGRASHARSAPPRDRTVAPDRTAVLREVAELLTAGHADLDEAQTCLAAGLHRAAHVSAWNGFTAMALTRLAAGDFAELHAVRPDWDVTTIAELARRAPGRVVVDLLVEIGAVDPYDEFAIASLHELRDRCARPTGFRPSAADTRDYLARVVTRAAELTPVEVLVSDVRAPSTRRQPTLQH